MIIVDPKFETIKSNLIQSIVGRLEDEVVKELVNALYHFAMPRLNPDDVTVCILHFIFLIVGRYFSFD